jgi:hypothetical protein
VSGCACILLALKSIYVLVVTAFSSKAAAERWYLLRMLVVLVRFIFGSITPVHLAPKRNVGFLWRRERKKNTAGIARTARYYRLHPKFPLFTDFVHCEASSVLRSNQQSQTLTPSGREIMEIPLEIPILMKLGQDMTAPMDCPSRSRSIVQHPHESLLLPTDLSIPLCLSNLSENSVRKPTSRSMTSDFLLLEEEVEKHRQPLVLTGNTEEPASYSGQEGKI